jgi:hypothetical protein
MCFRPLLLRGLETQVFNSSQCVIFKAQTLEPYTS